MQFIIGHSETKRKIEGPFEICASRGDLEYLIKVLQRYLDTGHNYGWIEIHEPMEPIGVNSSPVGWDT